MISAERKSPLNSTTTVSLFSYASSCLFPSSSSSSLTETTTTTTSRTEIRRQNSLSFPLSLKSLSFPSLSLLLIILSVLLCQDCVLAMPSSPPHKWPTMKYSLDKQVPKRNFTYYKRTVHDEMAQNDEPPRDLSQSVGVPGWWVKQSQDRMYYLRAENDQYLQFYQGRITGTKEINPPFGIVRFLSHKENIVIRSYLENKYLCMNEDAALYLMDTADNPECYIQELSLQDNGSYATVYHFTRYGTRQKYYLGIDCDPLLGGQANPNSKSSRFITVMVSDEEAKAATEAVSKAGAEGSVKPKCVSSADRRRAARAKRQKLKWRWCWNLDRMIQKRQFYMDRCRQRERTLTCDKTHDDEGEPKKRCVCDILRSMLLKPKRARRKCLVEKLSRWVENQNATSNSKAVLEASRLLVRNYPAIARRMRLLKARKNKQRQQNRGLLDQGLPKEKAEASLDHRSTTSTQLLQTVTSISHDQTSKRRRRRRRRRRIIKLNSILGRYGGELFLASTSAGTTGHSPAAVELGAQSHSSSSPKVNLPSVLSDDFKQALNSLSPDPPRRHRGNHKRRRHRRRHHKSASQPSQIIPAVGNTNLASSGASSPG